MAILQVTLFSRSLMRTVPVTVILPADKMPNMGDPIGEEREYPTLYLLHGIIGSTLDWLSGTRIERWAMEHDLCVVMPSGDNAFYVDRLASNNMYGQFVGEELVDLTRRMFPLSRKREDTFIGGLSMGGFGALRNGLKYNKTFGAICALSAAIEVEGYAKRDNSHSIFFQNRAYVEECFGDVDKVVESDKNPKYLVKKIAESDRDFPDIYMCCGLDDMLLGANQDFSDYLDEYDVKHTFETGPGAHEWDFWDTYIKKIIEWLPLEKTGTGINSGNVGVK